jgi:glutathione synthase/RimK-type ligase-like ATP-grasp enzyme
MADVRAALSERDVEVELIDQRAVLSSSLELDISDGINGRIGIDGRWIHLRRVTAAYLRPYESTRVRAVARDAVGGSARKHAEAFDHYLWTWAEHTGALVVNKPSAAYSNESKPYQAGIIRRFGFLVPATLITTDPDLAREFIAGHDAVVYKSISGVRSIVSRIDAERMSRIEDVRWCPTQFQGYVPGTDYRVHVVGDDVFSVEIECEADDYRYATNSGSRCEITQTELPERCANACRRLTKELGLIFSGIDLRRTPDGEWYCFEVNPSPGFSFFDTESGSIARAVAGQLAEGR